MGESLKNVFKTLKQNIRLEPEELLDNHKIDNGKSSEGKMQSLEDLNLSELLLLKGNVDAVYSNWWMVWGLMI